jgi:uncharacterized protein with PQ loop repeat
MFVGVAGFAWLLLLRVARSRSVAGLNLTTVTLSWAASALWASYALLVSDPVNLAVSVAAGSATTALLALVAVRHRLWRQLLPQLPLAVAGSGAIVAFAVSTGAHSTLPLAGSVLAAVMLWPQAYTAMRSSDLSGVSPAAFAVRTLFAGVGWLAHTAATGDIWFLVQFATSVPPALIVAARAAQFHRSQRPARLHTAAHPGQPLILPLRP